MNQTARNYLEADRNGTTAASSGASGLRFPSIEGLRCWMAWWVLIGHASNAAGIPKLLPAYFSPLFNTSIAVNVFIIVSGFVITHLIIGGNETYGVYIARRAVRLWPVYLVALALVLASSAAMQVAFIEQPFALYRDYDGQRLISVQSNLSTHVALHLSMLHGLVPHEILAYADESILSPAWSTSLEWQFYLVAPFCIGFIRRSKAHMIVSLLSVVAIVSIFHYQTIFHWRFPAFLPLSAHFFFVGILSRIALDYTFPVKKPLQYFIYAVALIGILVLVADIMLGFHLARESFIWAIFFYFILVEAKKAPSSPAISRVMRGIATNRILQAFGASSYSTYILHMPVIALLIFMASKMADINKQPVVFGAVLVAVIAMIPLSLLSYKYIERPCNSAVKRIMRRSS